MTTRKMLLFFAAFAAMFALGGLVYVTHAEQSLTVAPHSMLVKMVDSHTGQILNTSYFAVRSDGTKLDRIGDDQDHILDLTTRTAIDIDHKAQTVLMGPISKEGAGLLRYRSADCVAYFSGPPALAKRMSVNCEMTGETRYGYPVVKATLVNAAKGIQFKREVWAIKELGWIILKAQSYNDGAPSFSWEAVDLKLGEPAAVDFYVPKNYRSVRSSAEYRKAEAVARNQIVPEEEIRFLEDGWAKIMGKAAAAGDFRFK